VPTQGKENVYSIGSHVGEITQPVVCDKGRDVPFLASGKVLLESAAHHYLVSLESLKRKAIDFPPSGRSIKRFTSEAVSLEAVLILTSVHSI
jgi:hypothetical protein